MLLVQVAVCQPIQKELRVVCSLADPDGFSLATHFCTHTFTARDRPVKMIGGRVISATIKSTDRASALI